MGRRQIIRSMLLLALAVLMIVAGGYDDSPGLQGLGLLLGTWVVVSGLRKR